ncbi:MAG: hypothetical protein ABSA53_00240 [Streptosporangiaceae bacterium]|jgi:hypothetical protein
MAAGGDRITAAPGAGAVNPDVQDRATAGPGEAAGGPAAGGVPGSAGSGSSGSSGRRPWWVWAIPFTALFALLSVRNRFLFSTRLYEQGDAGANSILIAQAKHFTLLVGNYSREGFHHPGPAYMYVQAFGEYLFADALHVVPTAWNAHMLAVFALDCFFVALAVAVVYGWTRSVAGPAACFAVFTGFAIAYPPIINSDWMPYMYVLAYMVFVIAAGSLVAGRAQDAWIFALTGWFLIHGHACFLFFVPVITLAVLAAVLWPHRRTLRASVRSFFRERRGVWIPVAVISAVFALPIVVNLVLHWPGDFGKYLSYSSSGRAGGHGLRQVTRYALWFWWPHGHTWVAGLVPVAGYALALAVTVGLSRGPLRRLLLALLAVNVLSSLAFLFYAAVGIDDLTEYYIGYFYWSAPLVTVLVVVLGTVGAMRARLGACVAVLAAVATLVVFAVNPGTLTRSTNDIDESLPRVVATLAARAPGQLIVLHIQHDAWVETTGFLVQAERTGVKVCLDYPRLEFLMTGQFICTPAQVASGRGYWFYLPQSIPPGARVILRFSHVAVAPASG